MFFSKKKANHPNLFQHQNHRFFLLNGVDLPFANLDAVLGHYRRIYRKFLPIIFYKVNIPKVSAFCPLVVDKTESFSIITWLIAGKLGLISQLTRLTLNYLQSYFSPG